jgi:ABC-2 type transport system ATP-binding protein
MIETHDLSREYGLKLALSGLNLRVEPGEMVGFLGPNGAGKSTTVKILTGMIRPTRGRASVAGFDVVEQPIEVKQRIGYVPETAALYDALTASEYLELIACLHHLDRKTGDTRSNELFGLTAEKHQRLRDFSKGSPPSLKASAGQVRRNCGFSIPRSSHKAKPDRSTR